MEKVMESDDVSVFITNSITKIQKIGHDFHSLFNKKWIIYLFLKIILFPTFSVSVTLWNDDNAFDMFCQLPLSDLRIAES